MKERFGEDATAQVIDATGLEQRKTVEPLTNYFTTRLNREFNGGMSAIGGVVTWLLVRDDGTKENGRDDIAVADISMHLLEALEKGRGSCGLCAVAGHRCVLQPVRAVPLGSAA